MSDKLVIEARKFYRTRDGRKAWVACIVPPSPFSEQSPLSRSVIGYIDGYGSTAWRADGSWLNSGSCVHDIVAPWTESRTEKRIVVMLRRGDILAFKSQEEASEHVRRFNLTVLDQHEVTFTWQEPTP